MLTQTIWGAVSGGAIEILRHDEKVLWDENNLLSKGRKSTEFMEDKRYKYTPDTYLDLSDKTPEEE